MLLVLFACVTATVLQAAPAVQAARSKTGESLQLVEGLMRAFNDHDFDAMVPFVTPDVQWLSVEGDSIIVEAEGLESLGEAMLDYFASVPTVHSEIVDSMISKPYVIVRERARWTRDGKPHSQSALAVYLIAGDRIAKVWYYPVDEAERSSE